MMPSFRYTVAVLLVCGSSATAHAQPATPGPAGTSEGVTRDASAPVAAAQEARVAELNTQITRAYAAGRFESAIPLAQEELEIARTFFGPDHPVTLRARNDLAVLLQQVGRYQEAEQMHREILKTRAKLYGDRSFDAQTSMNNLAGVLRYEGKFEEAERLWKSVLQIQQEDRGQLDRITLTTLNNLGVVLTDEGRLGEAESVLSEALKSRQTTFGDLDSDTLTSMNCLARVLAAQNRVDEALKLYKSVLDRRRTVLGIDHPATLGTATDLANVLQDLGDRDEAEFLYRQVLPIAERVMGDRHLVTMQIRNNLVTLLMSQSRYGEAGPLAVMVRQYWEETLGPAHPETLTITNNLAMILTAQDRYSEAEPIFAELLQASRDALGSSHPTTVLHSINRVGNLAAQGRMGEAVDLASQVEAGLATWVGTEYYSTGAVRARRQLVASQVKYQSMVLSLAVQPGAPPQASDLAASVLLRWKGLALDEEAHLAHLARTSLDPHVRAVVGEIGGLHVQIARLSSGELVGGGGGGASRQLLSLSEQLDRREQELGQLSGSYREGLQMRRADLRELRARLAGLPGPAALLDFRLYQPVDFKTVTPGPPRWAGVLVTPSGAIRVRDLGPANDTAVDAQALLQGGGAEAKEAAQKLYRQLLAPFATELSDVERLYVAPDGPLYLVPFGLLRDEAGRVMLESKDVRLIQTGRDLLRAAPDRPTRGLVAMGGIDFEHAAPGGALPPPFCSPTPQRASQLAGASSSAASSRSPEPDGATAADLRERNLEYARERATATFDRFASLPGSESEVTLIAHQYCAKRPDEAVEVDTGTAASKARLRSLGAPPRVLHLATHGFYRAPEEPADQPLVLAGIALAGANSTFRPAPEGGGDADGILSALEALDLDLEGTELVVLSACETAQGQIDYGEGVSGLARALRTAGARQLLVTLRPIGDTATAAFMDRFYGHWLGDTQAEAAVALRLTQQEYLDEERARAEARAGQVQPPRGGEPAGDAAVQGGGVAAVGDGPAPGARSDGRGGAPPGQPSAVEPADAAPAWASFVLIGD